MNDQEVIVSVICDTFNHSAFISKCLDGFLAQKTNFIFEVLIHDDCSSDGTSEIISEYRDKYPDIIKPIFQSENQYSKGISIWQNYQFPRVRGKYIAICEGDDYWIDPYKLQKQVDFLENNSDYGLVYTNVNFLFESTQSIICNYLTQNNIKIPKSFEEHLLQAGYIAPCSWLLRREFLRYIDFSKRYVDMTFPIALDIWANSRVYFMNETTTVYRVLDESASHSKSMLKIYKIMRGVFDIQSDYFCKYSNSIEHLLQSELYFSYYKKVLLFSIVIDDYYMIQEANTFFVKHKMLHYVALLKLQFLYKWLLCLFFKRKGYKFDY